MTDRTHQFPGRAAARLQRPVKAGPGRPTQLQARQRQWQLLDTALTLFADKGFEATSIEAIAAAIGMAKSTIYSKYPGKMALFKAALDQAIADWMVPMDEVLADDAADLETTLKAFARIQIDGVLTPEGLRLLRINNAESKMLPEISAYIYQRCTEPTLETLADFFTLRLCRGDRQAARRLASSFLHTVVGWIPVTVSWGMPLSTTQLQQHIDHSVHLFLCGALRG